MTSETIAQEGTIGLEKFGESNPRPYRHLTEPQLRNVALMLASEGLLTDHEIAERLEVATSDVQRWLSQRFVRP
jgi:hypothetical protein